MSSPQLRGISSTFSGGLYYTVLSYVVLSKVKEIVELLDQSARAVRAGPAGGSKTQSGDVAPSIKVIRRQTVLVSATLAKGVSRLATILLSK